MAVVVFGDGAGVGESLLVSIDAVDEGAQPCAQVLLGTLDCRAISGR